MGLSVDWCTCDIGARLPEELGWRFQWGGTTPYNSDGTPVGGGDTNEFGWNSDCPFWISGSDYASIWSKYTTVKDYSSIGIADNKTILDLEDDPGYTYAGKGCRMPSRNEYIELSYACDSEWVENYKGSNINGRLYTLRTDPSKTLFFPVETGICHRTRSLYNINNTGKILNGSAFSLVCNEAYGAVYPNPRYYAEFVRTVKPKLKFVDMGLSVDWATCNIGANSPEEYGYYFQWGGTTPYNSDRTPVDGGDAIIFEGNSNCPFFVKLIYSPYIWTKYTTTDSYSASGVADNKTVLDLEDDAAHSYLCNDCRMPTEAEFNELLNACNTTWVTNYNGTGVNGRLFTLKTNPSKTLFFPAAGNLNERYWNGAGQHGIYLTSSLNNSETHSCDDLFFDFLDCTMHYSYRFYGRPVRAVKPKK